jgi:hypothetical protein
MKKGRPENDALDIAELIPGLEGRKGRCSLSHDLIVVQL